MALVLLGALLLVFAPAPAGQKLVGVASAHAARPDANLPAGALALPDRSFLRNERSACDFYVDPAGSNSNPGTQAAPWRTVGKAATTLSAGKVACVNSGTYDETGASAANSGTETAPIVLKRTPGSPTRPVIRLTQASSVLRIDRGYWIVDGLEFDLNRQVTTGMVFGASGHHIALRNSHVHDDARGAAIYISADDVSVEGSEIANNFHYLGEDSHGVAVVAPAARVLIRGNRIHDNGGDGVQCEYTGSPSDAQTPVNLTIQDNRFWTSPENQGRTEQGIDVKTCKYVSIRGSVPPDANDSGAANQKFYGFKSSSSAAGGSGAMVIHLGARNVLVENNRIWDSCHGIGVGRHDTAYGVPENLVVRRNAMFDLKAVGGACKGYGIGIQRVASADLYHNTLDRLAGSAFRFKHGYGSEPKSPNVDFSNNIVRDARSFLEIATGEISGFASDHNLFWATDGNQSRFLVDGVAQGLGSWQARQNGMSVLLADRNSRVADPLFVPGAGTTDDYLTQPASPARERALDNANGASFGSGPDLGFRETYDDPNAGSSCDTGTVDTQWPGEGFSPQLGTFTATVDVTPLGAPIGAGVGLSKGAAQHWTGMAAIVRFDDVSGNIDARNGGTYTAATPIPYKANARYRVRFVVDVAAHRYSAYVTPPGGGEITIGTNLAFRTEQQAVTSLDTRTVATGIGSLQACNLRISGASGTPGTTSVFALGDGADGSTSSRELANYVEAQNPDRFFYLGDVYESGTADEFSTNYDKAYGSLAHKTDPVIGNHEYANRSTGYYPYWQTKRGWTSEQAKHRSYVTPEGWQVIAYSSEHDAAAEASWVSSEVAKHAGTCRIVMAHKGRHVVTDTAHGDNSGQEPIWSRIVNKTAINLVGHNHIYGRLSPVEGVAVFVSGAGKGGLRSLGAQHHPVAASETRVPTALKLTLHRGAADFQQVDKNGTVYDSGRITCRPS